nr:MAG: hypothetical protein J07AB56_13040 [Candidatus Nanosalinarum sp. J07AB56]
MSVWLEATSLIDLKKSEGPTFSLCSQLAEFEDTLIETLWVDLWPPTNDFAFSGASRIPELTSTFEYASSTSSFTDWSSSADAGSPPPNRRWTSRGVTTKNLGTGSNSICDRFLAFFPASLDIFSSFQTTISYKS